MLSITDIRNLKKGEEVKAEFKDDRGRVELKGKVVSIDNKDKRLIMIGVNNGRIEERTVLFGYGIFREHISKITRIELIERKEDINKVYKDLAEIVSKEREINIKREKLDKKIYKMNTENV